MATRYAELVGRWWRGLSVRTRQSIAVAAVLGGVFFVWWVLAKMERLPWQPAR